MIGENEHSGRQGVTTPGAAVLAFVSARLAVNRLSGFLGSDWGRAVVICRVAGFSRFAATAPAPAIRVAVALATATVIARRLAAAVAHAAGMMRVKQTAKRAAQAAGAPTAMTGFSKIGARKDQGHDGHSAQDDS